MMLFMLVAVLVAFALLVAAAQRPRPSLFVAAILWGAYAVWEYYIATGVLCDKDCNIRVDLVFMFPVLWIAAYHAWRSYTLPPSKEQLVRGLFLSAAGLAVLAFLLGALGFNLWAAGAGVVTLALGAYAVKLKFAAKAE
jgi:hypothetical protein